MVSKYRTGGWFKEPRRHALAAKGVKTKSQNRLIPTISPLLPLGYAKKGKKVEITGSNLVDYIMQYEGGNMTLKEYFSFFGYLIKTGQVWHLQGMYGRQAARLIDDSLISKDGKVNWKEIESRGIDLDSNLYEE